MTTHEIEIESSKMQISVTTRMTHTGIPYEKNITLDAFLVLDLGLDILFSLASSLRGRPHARGLQHPEQYYIGDYKILSNITVLSLIMKEGL